MNNYKQVERLWSKPETVHKDEYKTTLIESDFEGNIFNSRDCVGGRSFRRAFEKEHNDLIPNVFNYSWGWCNVYGSQYIDRKREFFDILEVRYESFRNGELVNMMKDVEVGDEITFKLVSEREL